MLKPSEQWVCDQCGEVIDKPEDGLMEWLEDEDQSVVRGFRLVHNAPSSPLARCTSYDGKDNRSDLHLTEIQKEGYVNWMLSFIDVGLEYDSEQTVPMKVSKATRREYVEMFRRLTIPHYEEARQYWAKAETDGYFEQCDNVYAGDNLRRLVEKYRLSSL